MLEAVFITSTDTGVGKTFIAAELAKALIAESIDVAYYKPLSSGGPKSEDVEYIKKTAKCPTYNTYHFEPPLSPYAAAKIRNLPAGKAGPKSEILNIENIIENYKKISKKHEFVIVEGIGGVMVPITKKIFVADLIKELNLPTIIVARAGLGTLNHTLLTIEVLRKKKIKILGIIFNGYNGKDKSELSNAEIINEISGIPVLAKIELGKRNYDFGDTLYLLK